MNPILFFLFFTLSFSACLQERDEPPPILKLEDIRPLFPHQSGKVWIYLADSVVYNPKNGSVEKIESSSFLKIETRESFVSVITGDTLHPFVRYWRPDDSSEWQIQGTSFFKVSATNLIEYRENLSFLKIIAPAYKGSNWDYLLAVPNDFVIYVAGEPVFPYNGAGLSSLTELGVTMEIGNLFFDKVASIVFFNSENAISYRYATESYAEGVGLIYKEVSILDTQIFDQGLSWDEKAEKGFTASLRLLEVY